MARYLWPLALALMFLPDFALGLYRDTPVGLVRASDAVLVLLLALLLLAPGRRTDFPLSVRAAFISFFAVAALSTLLAAVRYPNADWLVPIGGLVKLAKLLLYAITGPLVARCVLSPSDYRKTTWALALGGLVAGYALLTSARGAWSSAEFDVDLLEPPQYQSAHFVSVSLGSLACFLIGMSAVAERKPYKLWIRLGIIAALLMGMLFTGARGGWTGLAVGILFLMVRIRPNARTVLATVFAITVATATISLAPAVRDRFGQIFNTSMASPTMQRLGVTDQERVSFWLWEGRKMRKSPFLGAGFYNRGEVSGLSPFGSHNFFIQMGLETGLIGLFCVLWLLKALWSSASSAAVDPALRPHAVAFQSSLLAACVASLSGEYLYGGIPVFILSVLYSTMIALKRVQAESELSVQRSEVVLPGQQPAPDELGAGACWRATRWPAG